MAPEHGRSLAKVRSSAMTMMPIEQSLAKILVPESYLAERRGQIRLLVREEARAELLDIDDPYYGEALCRYLLFMRNDRLKAVGLASLSPEVVFYNGHHWYLMATRLYLAAYGASIRHEPTLSHSIYQAACRTAMDWRIVEAIEDAVERRIPVHEWDLQRRAVQEARRWFRQNRNWLIRAEKKANDPMLDEMDREKVFVVLRGIDREVAKAARKVERAEHPWRLWRWWPRAEA